MSAWLVLQYSPNYSKIFKATNQHFLKTKDQKQMKYLYV